MSTQSYEQAVATTRDVLQGVSPDQLDAATPCASWKMRDLVNHVIDGQGFFRAMIAGEAPEVSGKDHTEGDFLASYDAETSATLACFQEEGALQRTVTAPWGAEMPGMAVLGLATTDTFTHGWDMAKASGQSTDLAPELATGILGASRQMIQDNFRGPEGAPFGVEAEAPEGATAADQLAAFLGRQV